MDYWTEINTAYCVAKAGTISKAARMLGVHRATVNRHIDALEQHLGARLFIRHNRGYQLTEIGQEFFDSADRAHDILDDFVGQAKVKNVGVEGEVIITTLLPISTFLMPALHAFRRDHPKSRVALLTGAEQLRLERAEAHIAVRAGHKPDKGDYVVQQFCVLDFALFAHASYLEAHGQPGGLDDLADHDFVGNPIADSPKRFEAWLSENVPIERVVFRSGDAFLQERAIRDGMGIGFLPVAESEPNPDLHQIGPSLDEWTVNVWLVTHADVHRTRKIQAMLAHLKALKL